MISEIQEYIDLVRSGAVPVCREQLLLMDLVERAFQKERLTVDAKQLANYLGLQKYFPFQLFPWEKFCFALHNCVYREDGQLRWPDLLIFVGRGAGKNGYLSFEDFALLTPYNGIPYYHIDICANNEDQAKTSFLDVYNVLEDNPKLRSHFYWNKEIIRNLRTKSELRFRTSNAKTKDGGRPGKVDFDEYHAYEDYKNINVFRTGLGKKAFPRTTITTTNGEVRDGPLDNLLVRADSILQGAEPDHGLLPFLCRLDDPEEVHNERMWMKANPSLPYLPVLLEEMRKEYAEYKQDNLGNSSFMTKRMNIPLGDMEADVTSWENVLATNRVVPDLTGQPCVWGIDYAKTNDFVAAGLLFKRDGLIYWLTHSWVCASGADLSRIKFPLAEAEARGLLTMVRDVEIAPEIVVEWLVEKSKKYRLIRGAMDNFRYTLFSSALKGAGFNPDKKSGNLKLVRPSDIIAISPVISSEFSNQRIVWGDDPLMRWYTNNTKQTLNPAGNVQYSKKEAKSRKTDGFMAFAAAMTCSDVLDCYSRRGPISMASMKAIVF